MKTRSLLSNILIASSFVVACSAPEKLERNIPIDFSENTKHSISFLEKKIPIPSNFKNVSLAELKSLISNSDYGLLIQTSVNDLEQNLNNSPFNFYLFHDKNKPKDLIFLLEGEYVDFNKNISGFYLEMLIEHMKKRANTNGFELTKLESRYFHNNKKKLLKLKFKEEYLNEVRYITQYIISQNQTSYAFTITSNEKEDFEDLAKNHW